MSTAESAGDGEGGGETMDQSAIPPTQPQPSSQHPPPSPLSGSYLIVVLPEPRTARDKDLILNRLAKGETLFVIFNFLLSSSYLELN